MKKGNLWRLLFATALGLVMASCASPSISEEEWNDIGASVTSSMKFYIAIEKTEAQAQERYGNRHTLDYWEWDNEECIHEVRLATLKHLVAYFHGNQRVGEHTHYAGQIQCE